MQMQAALIKSTSRLIAIQIFQIHQMSRNLVERNLNWMGKREEEVVAQNCHKYQLVPRRRFHGPFDTVALVLSGCSNTRENSHSSLFLSSTLPSLSFHKLFGQVDRCPAASRSVRLVGRMGFVVVAWCIVGACSPLVQAESPAGSTKGDLARPKHRRILKEEEEEEEDRTDDLDDDLAKDEVLAAEIKVLANVIRAKCGQARNEIHFSGYFWKRIFGIDADLF